MYDCLVVIGTWYKHGEIGCRNVGFHGVYKVVVILNAGLQLLFVHVRTQYRYFMPRKLMDGHDGKTGDAYVTLMDLVSMIICATTKDWPYSILFTLMAVGSIWKLLQQDHGMSFHQGRKDHGPLSEIRYSHKKLTIAYQIPYQFQRVFSLTFLNHWLRAAFRSPVPNVKVVRQHLNI